MITSMTGFGKSEALVLTKKLTVEIRTLNSKNIDLNFRLPHIFRELEPQLRGLLGMVKEVHPISTIFVHRLSSNAL